MVASSCLSPYSTPRNRSFICSSTGCIRFSVIGSRLSVFGFRIQGTNGRASCFLNAYCLMPGAWFGHRLTGNGTVALDLFDQGIDAAELHLSADEMQQVYSDV